MVNNYTLISHNKKSNRVNMIPIGSAKLYKTDISFIDSGLLTLNNQEHFEMDLWKKFGYRIQPGSNNYYIVNPYMYNNSFILDIYDILSNEDISVQGKKIKLKKILLELAKERTKQCLKHESRKMTVHSEYFYEAWKTLFDYAEENKEFLAFILQEEGITDDLKWLFMNASQVDVEELIEEECLPSSYVLLRNFYAYILKLQKEGQSGQTILSDSAYFPIALFPCSKDTIRDYFQTSFVRLNDLNKHYSNIRRRFYN